MVVEAKSYLTAPIEWSLGEDPEYPYEAEHKGHKLLVRLNDFPEVELYALIADGEEITNFDDWPDSWTRPSASPTTLNSYVPQNPGQDTIQIVENLDDVDSNIQKQHPVSVPSVQRDLENKEILERIKSDLLSPREQRLLELLIVGNSYEDISYILQEDIRTVGSDCNALKAKLKYHYTHSKKNKGKV